MPRLVPVRPEKLIKFFEKFGYRKSTRGPGDHIVMRKDGCARPLVIPDYREIPKMIIKSNLLTAGISLEKYFEVMSQI